MKRPKVLCALGVPIMLSLLVGCSGDEAITAKPTASKASPTGPATNSTSSTKGSVSTGADSESGESLRGARVPAAAGLKTVEGAGQFALFYYHQLGEAGRTADSRQARPLADGNCPPCNDYFARVDRAKSDGHHLSKNPFTASLVSSEKRPDGRYAITLSVHESSHRLVDEAGGVITRFEAANYYVNLQLNWQSGRWHVMDGYIS